MGTNKGTTGNPDSSADNDPIGHSPQFGKISGSAGASGSQGATTKGDQTAPSPRRGNSAGDQTTGGESGDPEGTDASGNRREDSVSGIIDSGKQAPSRGSGGSDKVK